MSLPEELLNRHIESIQTHIEYRFKEPKLLIQALTHRSYTNERNLVTPDNERLEFLGDSVLGFVVSQHLFSQHPDMREGELSRARAHIVCEASLAVVGVELELGEAILLGRGEDAMGGRTKASVIANAVEAIYGAVLVDGGLAAAEQVIRDTLGFKLASSADQLTQLDPKGRLQEIAQTRKLPSPTYILVSQSGPEHDRRFEVEVRVSGRPLARSTGKSKKEAASAAAVLALKGLEEDLVHWPEAKPEDAAG